MDRQLYDAARVDGADRWQQMLYVELPAIKPTIMIVLIMNLGGILNVGFEKTFLMQNSLNKSVSEVISTYVFNIGVKSSQFSFGSAALLYLNKDEYQPLQIILRNILISNQAMAGTTGAGEGSYAQQYADQIKFEVIIVSTVPVLCIYPFIQKYFEKGVMIGAVKG